MVQLLLSGCNGRMGHAVEAICAAEPELELTAGFDLLGADIRDFPVYASPAEFQGEADVVVDFSSPSALPALLSFGLEHRMPLVLATTGYDQGQLEEIQQAARSIPIFRSANLSLGVNILVELVRRTAAVLAGAVTSKSWSGTTTRRWMPPVGRPSCWQRPRRTPSLANRSWSAAGRVSGGAGSAVKSASPRCGAVELWATMRCSLPGGMSSLSCGTPP